MLPMRKKRKTAEPEDEPAKPWLTSLLNLRLLNFIRGSNLRGVEAPIKKERLAEASVKNDGQRQDRVLQQMQAGSD
jgi:hypothetical protein